MRMPFGVITLAMVTLTSPAFAGAGTLSWGKAGVSLVDYARDASDCAETSRFVAASIKPSTLRQLDALSAAQLFDTLAQMSKVPSADTINIVDAVAKLKSADDIARRTNTFGAKYVAVVSADVRGELQAVLDKCLVDRGYVPVRLTDAQTAALRRFRRHSAERTAYLHAIDSDAAVIAQQKVASTGQ